MSCSSTQSHFIISRFHSLVSFRLVFIIVRTCSFLKLILKSLLRNYLLFTFLYLHSYLQSSYSNCLFVIDYNYTELHRLLESFVCVYFLKDTTIFGAVQLCLNLLESRLRSPFFHLLALHLCHGTRGFKYSTTI